MKLMDTIEILKTSITDAIKKHFNHAYLDRWFCDLPLEQKIKINDNFEFVGVL